MLENWIRKWIEQSDSRTLFYQGELVIAGIFLVLIWIFKPKRPESGFKVREADLKRRMQNYSNQKDDPLAQARYERFAQMEDPRQGNRLLLEGIRLEGAPHEILGVPPHASPAEIQKAYRDLMKRFHPDRVGQQDSREWKDSQKIAEVIIRAKEEMLKKKP